jgi:hypothetical protein
VAISAAESEGLPELKDHLQRWLFAEQAAPGAQAEAKSELVSALE